MSGDEKDQDSRADSLSCPGRQMLATIQAHNSRAAGEARAIRIEDLRALKLFRT
jgi:hypothetical protein